MRKFTFSLFLILSLVLFSFHLFGVTAYPGQIDFKQPDGKILTIKMMGDEFMHWAKTSDGYTVMFNKAGYYEYAILDLKGDMVPSGIIAANPKDRKSRDLQFVNTLKKDLFYSKSQISLLNSIKNIREQETKSTKAFPTTGNRKLVCILIGFQDKAFTKTQSDFNNLYNQIGYSTGGATGSVKDFYLENSWNQFTLDVTVAGPYTASQNMSYYGANDASGYDVRPRELVTEAVNLADPVVNFANFDNDNDGSVDGVYVIYAGYGEEAGASADCIWAHAWSIPTVTKDGKTISKYSCSAEFRGNSGTTITAIGVICHEFGHVLGAPDYYDTDYSTGGQFTGTGKWDMMASGSWNNNGVTPAHHNAYTKVKVYGWATAPVLSSAASITVTHAEANQSFYQINSTTSGEYWIMENRQQVGFDAFIPGHGLIIYHVHSTIASASSSNNINATYPQKMYPVCANATTNPGTTASTYGTIDGTGCPFPGTGAKTSFTDATVPNMKSWAGANTLKPITSIVENTTTKTITFSFMGGGTTVVVPTVTTTAASGITSNSASSGGNVTADGGATVTARGVCYSTSQNPTTSNSTVASGSGTGTFSANITGLSASTTYYVRAYATNSAGTAYGTQVSFTTLAGSSLNLPVTQYFASAMPAGWTTQNTGTGITERWSMSNTANAGGTAYEAKCTYLNVNPGTTRLITPAINTVGVSSVSFSFKHMLDAYGTGVTLRVQTSNNLSTWTNTSWSVATGSTNIAANTVTFNITTNLNSATTYFALVADGNLYQIDYWYVDNISITAGSAGTIPTVTTTAISNITSSTATGGGNVTSAGSSTVTERGICYATTANPTTSNSKVNSGSGTGSFVANISGLTASTTYYVRAYATNSVGTAYGSQVSFTTLAGGGTTSDVTIGTGTSTQGYPINCYYGYERSASIYTVAEMTKVGSISKLAWYPTLTTTANVPVKIYIKQTTATTITSSTWATLISGATLVYSGTMAGTTANAWKEFTLSTAFNYTGGSNNLMVLVETNYGSTGTGTSTGARVRYSTATSKHLYIRADNTPPTGNGTVSSYRPNIKITITTASLSLSDGNNNIEEDDVLSISDVNVYPNPTNGLITIECKKEIKSIEVYSISGTLVYSNSTLTSNVVNLSSLSNGTYFVFFSDGVKRYTTKVIKY